MASLADFISPRKTGGGLSQPQNVRGVVTTAPATLADKAFVVLPEFSGDYHWECDWTPRGNLFPAVGVSCLVGFDNNGAGYLTWWGTSDIAVISEAPLNITTRGALVDGTTDDSEAWWDAAAAIPAAGGEILHPGGLSVAHSIRLKNGTKVRGGPGAKLKLKSGAPEIGGDYPSPWTYHRVLLTNANAGSSGNTGIEIDGIDFDGNHAGNAAVEAYPVIFYGVKGLTIPKATFRNCGRAGLMLGASQTAFVQNEDVVIGTLRAYDVGLVAGWGAYGIVSVDRFAADSLIALRGGTYVVDFETNVTTGERLRNIEVAKVIGDDCSTIANVVAQAAGQAQDVTFAQITGRNGPTSPLARLGRFTYTTRGKVLLGTTEATLYAEAFLVEQSAGCAVLGLDVPGTWNGGSGPAVTVADSSKTFVSLCDLPGGGGQTYAVQETGTCTKTIVRGNAELGGSVAQVLLPGTGSIFNGHGPGTPEAVQTAGPGSTFSRTNGGAGTSFYVKESGTGAVGWIPK